MRFPEVSNIQLSTLLNQIPNRGLNHSQQLHCKMYIYAFFQHSCRW